MAWFLPRCAICASLARPLHPFIRWRLDWRRENREGKRGRGRTPRPFSAVRHITRPLLPPRRPQQTQAPNNTQCTTTHTHANSFGAVLADPEAAWADWQPEYTAAVSGFDRLAGADCMAESFPRLGLAVLAAPEPLHYVALFSHTVGADVVVPGGGKKRALAAWGCVPAGRRMRGSASVCLLPPGAAPWPKRTQQHINNTPNNQATH